MKAFEEELSELAREGFLTFEKNKPLSSCSSFRIGGEADFALYPRNPEGFCRAYTLSLQYEKHLRVMGACTNVLFPDEGYRGVILFTTDMNQVSQEGETLLADAGENLTALSVKAWKAGLSGLEFAYGIPGSVGGGVFMNAGAYDHSLEEVVSKSRFYDPKSRTFGEYKGKEHCFSYRHSVYNDGNRVILSAEFSLKKDDPQEIRARMEDYMQRRKSKQPLEYPSAGSVFKRYPGYFTAKLIEEAGLKGLTVGGAQVSPKHAGFIVNLGSATAADVQKLVSIIEEEIYRRNGIRIERELIYF